MMYSSGHGNERLTSSKVAKVLDNGNGRKIIVPVHALSELYVGTLAVYVPSLTSNNGLKRFFESTDKYPILPIHQDYC